MQNLFRASRVCPYYQWQKNILFKTVKLKDLQIMFALKVILMWYVSDICDETKRYLIEDTILPPIRQPDSIEPKWAQSKSKGMKKKIDSAFSMRILEHI